MLPGTRGMKGVSELHHLMIWTDFYLVSQSALDPSVIAAEYYKENKLYVINTYANQSLYIDQKKKDKRSATKITKEEWLTKLL